MQTMQQQRAKYALEKVISNSKTLSPDEQKEFKSYSAALPAMIHINGLGQASAFFKSKGKTHLILYNILSEWLKRDDQPYAGAHDLLDGITKRDMHHYRLAQAEAQMLMDWIKKFSKAYLAGDDEPEYEPTGASQK